MLPLVPINHIRHVRQLSTPPCHHHPGAFVVVGAVFVAVLLPIDDGKRCVKVTNTYLQGLSTMCFEVTIN